MANKKRNDCVRCQDTLEMQILITNKVKNNNKKVHWLGGHLPAKYCPFCGRKLEENQDGK